MLARTVLDLSCACDTCRTNGGSGCVNYPTGIIPSGTLLDWPDVWKLVRRGAAEPEDDECRAAADMTPEQLRLAQYHQRRTAAGIHPDDFDAFDRGEMVGYYPDGSPVPGPNASHFRGEDEETALWIP